MQESFSCVESLHENSCFGPCWLRREVIETYYQDGKLHEVSGSAANPVRYEYGIEAGPGYFYHQYSKETKLTSTGGTNEWVKHITDEMGRPWKTVYPDEAYTQNFYDSAGNAENNQRGLLWKRRDLDGVISLAKYNGRGEVEFSVNDMDRDDAIDWSGPDRINKSERDVLTNHGTTVLRTKSSVYVDGSSTPVELSVSELSADGLRGWQTAFGLVSESETVYGADGLRVSTQVAPDDSFTVTTNVNGQVISVTQRGANGEQLGQTVYGYDTHGRQNTVTDARSGTTTTTYNQADLVYSTTSPVPGTGLPAQVTYQEYDDSLRNWRVTNPDGTTVVNEYYPTGLLKKTSGARTYPVEYTYDAQGRMATMKTWTNAVSNPTSYATTTWNYDSQRGWLDNKRYADDKGPDYTYTLGGQLKTRDWARGTPRVRTIYGYGFEASSGATQGAGLLTVTYSNDGGVTPDVTYTYDRRGRQETVVRDGMTTEFTYNDADQVLTEEYTGGTLGGVTLTQTYDTLLRRETAGLNTSPALTYTFDWDDDRASRLESVSDGTHLAGYTYLPNSPLVSQIAFKENGATRLTTTKQYDLLNRLLTITSVTNTAYPNLVASQSAYQYNQANQRTRNNTGDGSYWVYQYDDLGQVISGKKYWSDGSPVPGQQFEYGFDDIGNRRFAESGGDATGGNLRQAYYSPNDLNQYSSRTVPGSVDILGVASAGASVTVNSSAADYRRNEYFWENLGVSLGVNPLWQPVTNSAGGAPVTGNLLLPPSMQSFTYDFDGNMTFDGVWNYHYDAENRLYRVENPTTLTPSSARKKLVFEYDHQSRRIRKQVYNWATSAYSATAASDTKFFWDDWNLIQETTGSAWKAYMWGLDLSGTGQGAGGVGGLLLFSDSTQGAHFPTYDGIGNVMKLIRAADSVTTAEYEYDPFGRLIRMSGPLASLNPIRFSSKYQDEHTDLSYYGYRFYNAVLGRWANRDVIDEVGGFNLYAFVENAPQNDFDVLGMYEQDFHFYVVYYLLRSKCFAAKQAYQVAWASQNVDDDSQTNPLRLGLKTYLGDSFSRHLLRKYHFSGSTATSATARNGLDAAADVLSAAASINRSGFSGASAFQLGTALHTYADTWSHEGFTAWRNIAINDRGRRMAGSSVQAIVINHVFVGHANVWHDPDEPFRDPSKAIDAALNIYALLPDLCGCASATDEVLPDLQRQFQTRGAEQHRIANMREIIRERFGDDAHYTP